VDATGSAMLTRPGVIAAAAFAAQAHEGQMRLTRQPYIMHCVETAAITESLLSLTFYGEDDDRHAHDHYWLGSLSCRTILSRAHPSRFRTAFLSAYNANLGSICAMTGIPAV